MPRQTYDLSTDIGKVRLKIGDKDVDQNGAHFEDGEIRAFLDEGGSVLAASGLALTAWAAEVSRADEVVDTGSWRGDTRDVVAKMTKLAKQYFDLAGYAPGQDLAFVSAALDWTPQVAAGRQVQEDD
jgi:hypothetical protein